MFHPVGSLPPSVYWRRRLVLLASGAVVLVLIILTINIATSGGGPTAKNVAASSSTAASSIAASSIAPGSTASSNTGPSNTPPGSASTSARAAAVSASPVPCAANVLSVTAVVGATSYKVGDQPLLELQVTNTGTAPCVQDLADKAIEMRVYNGESRVWGSHDCQVQPGTNLKTLAVNTPVRVAITWSGLTSQPQCAGTRQRVGAGTYTLYALLSGRTGKAAQFTIN